MLEERNRTLFISNIGVLIIFFILTMSPPSFSQGRIKYDQIQHLKQAKVYLGLTGKENIDKLLREVVKEEWDFTPIEGEEDIEILKERIKKENISFITITKAESFSGTFKTPTGSASAATVLRLFIDSPLDNRAVTQYLCFAQGMDSEKAIYLGTKMLVSTLEDIYSNKLKSNGRHFRKYLAKNRSSVFLTKTLYVPEEWLEKISQEEFRTLYPNKIEFLPFEDCFQKFKDQDETAIFIFPLKIPLEGSSIDMFYFVEGTDYKSVAFNYSNKGAMAFGVIPSYSGTISKNKAKTIAKTSEGKW